MKDILLIVCAILIMYLMVEYNNLESKYAKAQNSANHCEATIKQAITGIGGLEV